MSENQREREIRIGNRLFKRQGKTYVMGILNVTPDSFYDGGKWKDMDQVLRRVESMIDEGMDLLDVGGESTRPGYTPVPEEEEIDRIAPVIRGVKSRFDIPVSLDTGKSKVAKAGIEVGADMINDIQGLKGDPKLADVIARGGVSCCLVHNRESAVYGSLLSEVKADLEESVRIAKQAQVADDRIILDPGVGFGKSREQNLQMIRDLEQLRDLGYPILLGCSRKSVIGITLGLPVEERLEGTLATTVMGVIKGCSFVRVHDVKENVRAIRMAEAILGSGENDMESSHG